MSWCLIPSKSLEFKKGLKDGTIDPAKLAAMDSVARHAFLSKFVGEENSTQVNSLFESRLLLKNQKAGYISWAKKVSGITPQTRRDMLSRIEKMDKVLDPKEGEQFLKDLAETKLKVGVTQEEAKKIADLTKKMQVLREKSDKQFNFPTENDRLAFGSSKVDLENYVNDLKLKSREISLKEKPLQKVLNVFSETPGVLKSIKASLDNSFWGRQGIKVLANPPTSGIWLKNFLKSWGDIVKELKGEDALYPIKADIYSRPNALNGKYRAGGYGLDVLSEEAFPSSLPEKIPVLGRLFKASESAYNGAALRLRADLADRFIKLADRQGINTLDKNEAEGIGHLVGSLTGRGSIQLTEGQSKATNVLFFSVKFLKSNFDTLTAHAFDSKASSFVKKESAKSLLGIIATLGSVLATAKMIDPESAEEDPRSANFGKIKIFGHWTDITGGMSSLITLASRLIPTSHNGEWGLWTKSATTGKFTNLTSGKYGQQTAMDVFNNFWQGKLSPMASIVRDLWTGRDFLGRKPTLESVSYGALTPISIENFSQLKSEQNSISATVMLMILDGLGYSVRTNPPKKQKKY